MTTSNFADLSTGVKIHYLFHRAFKAKRSAGLPPVVMVHGWPDFSHSWRSQLAAVAEAGHDAIAIDMRGFGQTTLGKLPVAVETFTWKAQASDVVALLDHLQIKHAVLLGHDWGGAVVWAAARRYPDRFIAVAALCTPFRPRSKTFLTNFEVAQRLPMFYYQHYFQSEHKQAAADLERDVTRTVRCIMRGSGELIPGWMKAGDKDFLARMPRNPPASKLLGQDEKAYIDTFSRTGYFNCLHWYSTAKLNWQDETELPQRVVRPALMVTAGKDAVLMPAMSEGMEQWVPRLSRGHVQEASHWIQMEAPEQVNALVVGWLRTIDFAREAATPAASLMATAAALPMKGVAAPIRAKL